MGVGNEATGRPARRPGETRFREPAGLKWRNPVLVVCPHCGGRAVARDAEGGTRLQCSVCTLRRDWSGQELRATVDGRPVVLVWRAGLWVEPVTGRPPVDASATPTRDARFDVPLWLVAECCGHVLWARNEVHLDYLQSYVAATLRDRSGGLSMKLPTWMKRAGNRDEVLRAIDRLRATLA